MLGSRFTFPRHNTESAESPLTLGRAVETDDFEKSLQAAQRPNRVWLDTENHAQGVRDTLFHATK